MLFQTKQAVVRKAMYQNVFGAFENRLNFGLSLGSLESSDSRGSLENHTRFKTLMVKIYTCFQTKTTQKPYPLGRHIPI